MVAESSKPASISQWPEGVRGIVSSCINLPSVIALFHEFSQLGLQIPLMMSSNMRKSLLSDPAVVSILARAMERGVSANRLAAVVFGQKPGNASRQITVAIQSISA